MDEQKHEALIARLGESARRNPRFYKLRVGLLALLGYGYILFFLALLLSSLLVVYLWSLAIPLLILLLRALWVRLETPTGLRLEAEQAPRLFQLLRKTSTVFQRPTFHVVLVTGQMNAGVTQIPRLGIFGWYRNYLCLGMPLMLALSPKEFEALMAHELAHLFGAHSRFAGWIVRVGRTWDQLIANLEIRRPRGAFLFRKFFQWYSPLFSAYAFVLDRSNEIEADQFSADWAGAEEAAACLVKIRLYGTYWDSVLWPKLSRFADASPEPNVAPHAEMRAEFRRGIPNEEAEESLRQALLEKTTNDDPHPALADRMKHLGKEPRVPGVAEIPAAEHFLGTSLPQILNALDERWRDQVCEKWKERYEVCETHRKRLSELEEKAKQTSLASDESLEYAQRREDLRGSEDALPLYESMLERTPDYPPARYAVGRILLSRGDEKGMEHIEKAMALDPQFALSGCAQIRDYLFSKGKSDEAMDYHRRYLNQFQKLDVIRRERSVANSTDRYWSHDLKEEEIAAIAEQLARYPQIARAYFVWKYIRSDPNTQFFLLCLEWRLLRPMLNDGKLVAQIASELKIPRENWAVVSIYGKRQLARVIKRVYGARIYRRPVWLGLRRQVKLLFQRTS